MQQDFKRIFSTDNEGNSEVILAVSYMEGEAENSLPHILIPFVSGRPIKIVTGRMEVFGMMRLIYRITGSSR